MAQTRSDLKRKAMDLQCSPQFSRGGEPTMEQFKKEKEFERKYGSGIIMQHPQYHQLMRGLTQLITNGADEWAFDLEDLERNYQITRMLALGWTLEYLIPDISFLPEYQIRRLITRADGFYAQIDWAKIRSLLPSTVATHFGDLLGELLIHLTIHERFFERPFWYLDGKRGSDDPNEDPEFGEKLQYLFERFYEITDSFRSFVLIANPRYGVLWKMQTQRLTNSGNCHRGQDAEFGQYNAHRHESALAGFADELLTSEPFCWLLRDSYPSSSPQAEKRRAELIKVLRKGLNTMIKCETWTNGQPVLRGIAELGGVWSANKSATKSLHPYTWRPRHELYNGQRILFVVRPGLAYVDSLDCYGFLPQLSVTEVCGAEVIPACIPGNEEESDTSEDNENDVEQDDDDEEWHEDKNA